jgi:20S proteasome alpha/beta subunit
VTVGVAYRVPGLGAVLVSDGRVTHDQEIVSDVERKFVVCGATAVLVSGTVGQVWRQLQERPPRSFAAFRERLAESDDETDWLAYDRRSDRLWAGDVRLGHTFAALGSGGSLALGALEVSPTPRTLEAAEKVAIAAARVACRRNVTCGGRIRVLVVPRRGAISVRG